ncbi:DUF5994 family protein [Streptomyces sp. NPDC001312]|uniref:DUF5994 family protein n=1 Tax=Streptomyces sp. NPDC001312 TaxID=3364561 RepID=UPI0036A285DC
MTTPQLHSPSARLRLGAQSCQGGSARRIDGAWWPRSYDLTAELPGLLAGLSHRWGHISSVHVNGAGRAVRCGGRFTGGRVERVGGFGGVDGQGPPWAVGVAGE